MIVIKNNIIPLKGFKAMNLFGVIFIRKGKTLTDIDKNHEYIHTIQMYETLFIGFYLWYIIEYLFRWIWRFFHKPSQPFYRKRWMKYAYYDISFEQEAYEFQKDMNYIKNRKLFSWIKYLRKRKIVNLC